MPIGGFGVLTDNHNRVSITNYSAAAISVTSSASSNTFGSWVEMVADVGDRDVYIKGVGVTTLSTSAWAMEIEIGKGAAASEVAVFKGASYMGSAANTYSFIPVGIRVPASSRVSARIKTSSVSRSVQVHFNYIKL